MISNQRVLYHLLLVGWLVLVAACGPVRPAAPLSQVTLPPTLPPSAASTPDSKPSVTPVPSPTRPAATIASEGATPTAQVVTSSPTSPASATPGASPAPVMTPTSPASPTSAPPAFPPVITLEPVLSGFQSPVYLTHAGQDRSGGGRLFVVEKEGRIYLVENGVVQPVPFLDIAARVGAQASEQGLLSVAFPPDYAATGLFYVNYTDLRGDTVVARYRLVAGDPRQADPNSEQKLLQIEQPAANHNGGQLQFGPDGYLYIGMGDGGAAGDPWGNAQNPGVLLGKLLRINVSEADLYTVPDRNPWLDQPGARPELWAVGLRNPWRFSFDRLSGDLYIADVGQNTYEEIDFQPASSPGGENYGWDVMEGEHCFEPSSGCNTADLVRPVAEYDHSQGCSITGGYVYRGARYPELAGVYFFGDFCSGNIWGLKQMAGGEWQMALLLDTDINISSFGEDAVGELYVVGYRDGMIYHLAASP